MTEDLPEIPIPFDVEQAGDYAVFFYVDCILRGESKNIAEMCALRQAPRVMTDDVYLAGHGSLEKQIPNPKQLELVVRTAMRNGYKPKHTDVYEPSMARYPGDPQAFVNHGQGLGHVKKVCEQRGVEDQSGTVRTKARQPEKDPWENPKHRLAPDIVARKVRQRINENPDLARVDKRDLAADVVAKHGSQ